MRKKTSFSTRLKYIASWIRNPSFLLAFITFLGLFTLTLSLAFPCGKFDHPINGICGDRDAFTSPLLSLGLGIIIASIFAFLLALQSPSDGNWSIRGFVKDCINTATKRPKWRKRWYPVAFVAIYVPLAILNYLWHIDGGLRWYNYVGQYVLLLPLVVSTPASWMLTVARRLLRKKGY